MKLKNIKNKKIWLDMDGVVADFAGGISTLIGEKYSQEKYKNDKEYMQKTWDAVNAHTKSGGRFWYELEEMGDAEVLWKFIQHMNVEILSATGSPDKNIEQQKREWVKEKFGNLKVNLVVHSSDKAKYAKANHILIDDQSKSIDPWVAAGGIGILHTDADTTIKKLKEILYE